MGGDAKMEGRAIENSPRACASSSTHATATAHAFSSKTDNPYYSFPAFICSICASCIIRCSTYTIA